MNYLDFMRDWDTADDEARAALVLRLIEQRDLKLIIALHLRNYKASPFRYATPLGVLSDNDFADLFAPLRPDTTGLPSKIRIYRGGPGPIQRLSTGRSWTLLKPIAQDFATRFGAMAYRDCGLILTATTKPAHLLAFFNQLAEGEVLLTQQPEIIEVERVVAVPGLRELEAEYVEGSMRAEDLACSDDESFRVADLAIKEAWESYFEAHGDTLQDRVEEWLGREPEARLVFEALKASAEKLSEPRTTPFSSQ